MTLNDFQETKLVKGYHWPAQTSIFATAFEIFCKTIFKFYNRVETHGLENLPKTKFLICSNHSSHLDSALLMVCAQLRFKDTGLIAAKDYFFDNASRSFLHQMLNLIPIERKSGCKGLEKSIELCELFLSSGGKTLVIYPEGTRSVTGEMSRFKEGAFIMAHRLNLPIVPAYIHDAQKALPKGCYVIRPRKIKVFFAKPINVLDFLPHDQHHAEGLSLYKEVAEKTKESIEAMKNGCEIVCK